MWNKLKVVLAGLLVGALAVGFSSGAASAETSENRGNISESDWNEYCAGLLTVDVTEVNSIVFQNKEEEYIPLSAGELGWYYSSEPGEPVAPSFAPDHSNPFIPCQAVIAFEKTSGRSAMDDRLKEQLLFLREQNILAQANMAASNNASWSGSSYSYATQYYSDRAKAYTASMIMQAGLLSYTPQNKGNYLPNLESVIDQIQTTDISSDEIADYHKIVYWHVVYVAAQDGWVEDIYKWFGTYLGNKGISKLIRTVPTESKVGGPLTAYIQLLQESEGFVRGVAKIKTGEFFYGKLVEEGLVVGGNAG